MKITLLPRTVLGKVSLVLAVLFGVCLAGRVILGNPNVYHSRFDDILSILLFFLEYISAGGAFITGLTAVIKDRERSVIILLYTILLALGALLWFAAVKVIELL